MKFSRVLAIVLVGGLAANFVLDRMPNAIAQAVNAPAVSATPSSSAVTLPAGTPQPGAVGSTTIIVPATIAPDTKVTVSAGSVLNEIIQIALLAAGTALIGLAGVVGVKLLTWMGVKNAEQYRAKIEQIASNGVALARQEAAARLPGKLTLEVQNDVMARAITYVEEQGAETLKKLGYNPDDPKDVEALRARVAKAIGESQFMDDAFATPETNPAPASA